MGTVLCIAGCLVASLAPTDEMAVTYPLPTVTTKNTSDVAKCPPEAKVSLVKDHRPRAIQQNLLPSARMLEQKSLCGIALGDHSIDGRSEARREEEICM